MDQFIRETVYVTHEEVIATLNELCKNHIVGADYKRQFNLITLTVKGAKLMGWWDFKNNRPIYYE